MARFWVRNQSTSTLTSATTLAINISIYQNSRETALLQPMATPKERC